MTDKVVLAYSGGLDTARLAWSAWPSAQAVPAIYGRATLK